MHPFINKAGSLSEVHFEVANDSTLKPENDKANRVPSAVTPNKDKGESKGSGGKSDRRYNNENFDTSFSHISKTSRNIRAQ